MKVISLLVVGAVLTVGCAGQVVSENTEKTSEAIDPNPAPPPTCSTHPAQRYWLSNGKPGNPICTWSPDRYFSGLPVYNFIKHIPMTVRPQFVPCGPIVSALEGSCYQESLAGEMQCQATLDSGNAYCQGNANYCLQATENNCMSMQNSCEKDAYNQCYEASMIDMNCYAALDGDCQAEGDACASFSPSCENYELECEQTVSQQTSNCQASVFAQYQSCVLALGTCI